MLRFRNEEQVEGHVDVADDTFELVAKESAVSFGTDRFGFGAAYRRPTAVRSRSSGSSVPIRDHVMIVRVVAAVFVALAAFRRYANG